MAQVRSVSLRRTSAGSMQKVSGSASANTGDAPQCKAGEMEACQVTEGTMTSRPSDAPAANMAECSAAVPLQTARAKRAPTNSRNSASNFSISS